MIGLRFAAAGLCAMARRERNFRIHLCAAYYAGAAGFLFGLDRAQGAVLAVTIFLVLALECVNTVIEAVVDIKTQRKTPAARFAKDAAAGGVLLGAIGALAVAALLFADAQRIGAAWQTLTHSVVWPCALLIPLPLWILFIIGKKSWRKDKKR